MTTASTTPARTNVDALLDLARASLDAAPEDRSGEDRTLVVVHVAAEQLADRPTEGVPAGTPADLTCHVEGVGPVEPETARRLACDATLLGAVVDRHGKVLALGRTRRLVSRACSRSRCSRRSCTSTSRHRPRSSPARLPWRFGSAPGCR